MSAALAADPAITHVIAIHCETSSGILNPVAEISAAVQSAGRKLLLDSMSAFGALDMGGITYEAMVSSANNLSIATGRPPIVHGICGNYLYDRETGTEVMMSDVRFLRAPTVFAAFHQAGARVAIVTAKDKLRALLGAGLTFTEGRARCFSAERAATSTLADHGQHNAAGWLNFPQPEVYSATLSEFVFAAGVKLLTDWRPDLMYLTTTDDVQHKYAPHHPQAQAFYAMFDRYLSELDALGAAIVVTADHGMKPKHLANGLPGDRIGDVVMIATENMTLGTSAHRHDLAALNEPLRSHGGLTEQEVPFIVNRVLDLPSQPRLRNFDALFYATTAAAQ